MRRGRLQGALSLPKVITVIIAGTIILSLLFFTYWRRFINQSSYNVMKSIKVIN